MIATGIRDPYIRHQLAEYEWARQLGADLLGLTTTAIRRARVRAAICGQGIADAPALPAGPVPETNRERFLRLYRVELDTSETEFPDVEAPV